MLSLFFIVLNANVVSFSVSLSVIITATTERENFPDTASYERKKHWHSKSSHTTSSMLVIKQWWKTENKTRWA